MARKVKCFSWPHSAFLHRGETCLARSYRRPQNWWLAFLARYIAPLRMGDRASTNQCHWIPPSASPFLPVVPWFFPWCDGARAVTLSVANQSTIGGNTYDLSDSFGCGMRNGVCRVFRRVQRGRVVWRQHCVYRQRLIICRKQHIHHHSTPANGYGQ